MKKIEECIFDSLDCHPSVICISEHWLKQESQFRLNKLDSYKGVLIFSRSECLSGGGSTLAGCDLPVKPVNMFNGYETECCECYVVVKSLIPCIVIFLYRPPKDDNQSLDLYLCLGRIRPRQLVGRPPSPPPLREWLHRYVKYY